MDYTRHPELSRRLFWRNFVGLLVLLQSFLCSAGIDVLWKEGFEQEDFWTRWHSEGGIWAVGAPKIGPEKPYSGLRCAATLLEGNYPPSIDTRLVRERVFVVPAATLNPRLRFWEWFHAGPGAVRAVEAKTALGDWRPLQALAGGASNTWSRTTFDLRPFAGQALQLAFHFQANGETNTAAGWYLDELTVESTQFPATLPLTGEGFENGLGDWTVENDVWQVESPRNGPQAAWQGTNCVTATLATNAVGVNARLVSPEFVIVATNQVALLTFAQWHDLNTATGSVELREGSGDWQPVGIPATGASGGWTPGQVDLTPYTGKLVQVAFRIHSGDEAVTNASWFVDQVAVELQPVNPPVIAPSVRIERTNADSITLCPDMQDGVTRYILEACDDLNRQSEPSRWVELKIVEPGACAVTSSSLNTFQFFRLRAATQQ